MTIWRNVSRYAAAALGSAMLAASLPAAAPAQDALAPFEAALKPYLGGNSGWDGPTEGPVLEAGKSIVILPYDMKNPGNSRLVNAFTAVAGKFGWTVTLADGQGTTTGQQAAINQALSLKPDGIVLVSFPDTFIPYFQQARDAGIKVVGLTSAPDFGPFVEQGIDWNVMQRIEDLGKALADWVIVDSKGEGRVVLISDKAFSVVEAKVAAMRAEFQRCSGCEIVLDTQVPFADANVRLPQLVPSWLNQYGLDKPLYIAHPADYFITFEIPALRSAGVQHGQVVLAGMDGDPAVYDRIRADDSFQKVTIPFPFEMQAYQAVDTLNRLFAGQTPADYSSPVLLIDKTTVDTAGGENNEYIPQNGYAEKYAQLWKTGKTTP
ncbi:substrate-binding domain-containing protein [Prosthecomicrobium pneumaticum]|uniref:Ribose transport system substrate-binding protein n=1 Tax=Prosthecomicrobium pneumaticum TaxID=81895 RepID=A0A7W9FQA1_9HYPH|nr:substrate-binding domain-containing protein [Prosthecomicrobium pneumaticum]MBB5754833.1 ribose transport system substrate-binding protein [Prosthecomicrobium pneumaticum]